MTSEKVKGSRAWLSWTGLLVIALLVAGPLMSAPLPSRALAPLAVNVTKSVSPTVVLPGQTPAPLYTVTFQNTGAAPVVLDRVADTLPAGFVFSGMHASSGWHTEPADAEEPEIVWNGPITVPANSTLTFVYAVYVPPSVQRRATPYTNSVVGVSGATTIGPATANLYVGAPSLSVTKQASPLSPSPGQAVDFDVVFANTGEVPGTLTEITDVLDPDLSFTGVAAGNQVGAPVVNGQTLTWNGPFEVPAGGTLTAKYRAQATSAPGWHWGCNSVQALSGGATVGPAQACVTIGPDRAYYYLPQAIRNFRTATFTIAKSANPTTVTDEAGQEVVYTVTIANIGNTSGQVASVVDTLPAGFTFLGMAAGSQVTANPVGTTGTIRWDGPFTVGAGQQLRLLYRVAPSQTPGVYQNSASVVALEGAPPPGPASASVTVEKSLLLEEHFDENISRWTKFLNYWRLSDEQWYWAAGQGVNGSGAVRHNCGDCATEDGRGAHDALLMYLQPGAEQWTDYRIEAKIFYHDAVGSDPQGLWVRGQYEDSDTRGQWLTGYYVVAGGRPDSANHYVRLSQLQTLTDCWGNACNNPQNLYNFNNPHALIEVSQPGAFTRNAWHTLTVEVRGDRISAWFDGVFAFEYQDTKEPFMTGTVGLKTYKGEWINYDDVIVTPLK